MSPDRGQDIALGEKPENTGELHVGLLPSSVSLESESITVVGQVEWGSVRQVVKVRAIKPTGSRVILSFKGQVGQ